MNNSLHILIVLPVILPLAIFIIIYGVRIYTLLTLLEKGELLVVARKIQEQKFNLIARSSAGLLSLLDAAYLAYKSGEITEAIAITKYAQKHFGTGAYQMRIYLYLFLKDRAEAQRTYEELDKYRRDTGQVLFSKKSMEALQRDITSNEILDFDKKIKEAGSIKEYTKRRIIGEKIYVIAGIAAGIAVVIIPVVWALLS